VADKFIRVRLTRIDTLDLRLFVFDYDLTLMIFFLSAEGKVYARYGGRDPRGPDERQSLAGLRYTMESVLRMHRRAEPVFAPRPTDSPRSVWDLGRGRFGRCMHCHQVKERLIADLQRRGKWERDMVWRYPLPGNLGFDLEVDRGNIVKEVKAKSPAAASGLKTGDTVQQLGGVWIHSFADVQYALDRAPKVGAIDITWRRGGKAWKDKLALPEAWRKTDLSWRPSMWRLLASVRLSGTDLTDEEKQRRGLPARFLAFRQRNPVSSQAETGGIRAGDIILGIDGKRLEMDVDAFQRYVQGHYLIGDRVTINLIRDDKPMSLPMTFRR
jgi:hypothetical protein